MKLLSLFHRFLRSCNTKNNDLQPDPLAGSQCSNISEKKSSSELTDSRKSSILKSQPEHNSSDDIASQITDAEYWWSSTAQFLQIMLSNAGYQASQSKTILDFYQNYIVDNLGPQPTADVKSKNWRSFMTDDFTPVEFSWNWGLTSALQQPTIRFSIEPIDQIAGSAQDPWNMRATLRLMQQLEKEIPGCDCSIFNRLAPRLADICSRVPAPQITDPDFASPSSMFMAFDLDGHQPTVKAYMLPFIHLTAPCQSRGQVIRDFLLPFAQEEQWKSLVDLLEFGVTSDTSMGIEPFMIAFDCIPKAKSRMKIYFRAKDTSFASVTRILSAHNDHLSQGSALAELRTLWHGIFGVDPAIDPNAPLPCKTHETAGILYYYEVRPGSPYITAKVYLPAKHYGIDDATTTLALAAFFRAQQQRQQQQSGKSIEACWADRYVSMVESVCTHRALGASSGLHSYVTCSLKGGALDCTSYLSPEIYHANRWTRSGDSVARA